MEMIDPNNQQLSVRKLCEILSVPRSSVYYQPIPEKPENVKMMHLMDKHLLVHPTEGVVSMVDWLKEKGYPVDLNVSDANLNSWAIKRSTVVKPDQRGFKGIH